MEFESADPSVVRSIKQREFLNAWLRAAAKHRPLPVRAPEELVLFGWKTGRPFPPISIQTGALVDPISGESTSTGFSYLTLQRFQEEHATISGVVAFSGAFPFGDDGDSADSAQLVSGNYFTMLGVPPERGRVLIADDDRTGAPLVAVISHRFWDRRYGRDPQVIGRTIAVGNLQPVIVGVTPAGFAGTQDLGSAPVKTRIVGRHNVLNILGATRIALELVLQDSYAI